MMIKIVWQEQKQEKPKVGKGNLVSEDNDFITIGLDNTSSITISKKHIISIRRF